MRLDLQNMDYNCKDIPMKLDVKHQPLNFDIYLNNRVQIPRTSVNEQPYDFHLELDALQRVNQILARTSKEDNKPIKSSNGASSNLLDSDHHPTGSGLSSNANDTSSPSPPQTLPPPSCPVETPLTPIKSSYLSNIRNSEQTTLSDSTHTNHVNPKDFEDTHYNPFDHLELQTIDERRELDLVFQASYASQSSSK